MLLLLLRLPLLLLLPLPLPLLPHFDVCVSFHMKCVLCARG
jgi:hypothetical protein